MKFFSSDMQKFPLRMKDNDLLVTELYHDPSNDAITALSVYLTPKTSQCCSDRFLMCVRMRLCVLASYVTQWTDPALCGSCSVKDFIISLKFTFGFFLNPENRQNLGGILEAFNFFFSQKEIKTILHWKICLFPWTFLKLEEKHVTRKLNMIVIAFQRPLL